MAECGRGSGGRAGVGGGTIAFPIPFEIVEETAVLVISAVSTLSAAIQERTQHVYILMDPRNNDIIKYVGRTNDPVRRLREHKRDLNHPERAEYKMRVIASGLTIGEAKVVEQLMISAFTLGYLENARREIAVRNVNAYQQYMGAAKEIFVGATEDGLMLLLGG